MYYKKNRSIIRSIKNNKNNKAYYALIVVMLAAIGIIAACIILNTQNKSRPDEDRFADSTTNTQMTSGFQETSELPEESSGIGVSTQDGQGGEEGTAPPQDGSGGSNPAGYPCSDYAVCLFMEEKLLAVCRLDEQGSYSEIMALTQCAVGENISGMLKKGENSLCLSNLASPSSKNLWKSYAYKGVTYYVQYYSQVNGIEFHSALYQENCNSLSVVRETYEMISGSGASVDLAPSVGSTASDEDTPTDSGSVAGSVDTGNGNTESDAEVDMEITETMVTFDTVPSGVTLTVQSARWLYENVPGFTDIYIYRNIKNSPLEAVKALQDNNRLLTNLLEADYMANGALLTIPQGFHGEPTDTQGNANYCPHELGELKNAVDKTYEMGQVAYSFVEEKSSLPKILFDDAALTAADGTDISQYLIIEADFSAYTPKQMAALNYNNFLIPGNYPVRFVAADLYGNILEKTVYLHVVDTTPPVIRLAANVTEMNKAQTETPEYIIGLVTVTDLCQLTPEGITYALEEHEEAEGEGEGEDENHERPRKVIIHYSVSDIYGNIGTFDLELKRVGD